MTKVIAGGNATPVACYAGTGSSFQGGNPLVLRRSGKDNCVSWGMSPRRGTFLQMEAAHPFQCFCKRLVAANGLPFSAGLPFCFFSAFSSLLLACFALSRRHLRAGATRPRARGGCALRVAAPSRACATACGSLNSRAGAVGTHKTLLASGPNISLPASLRVGCPGVRAGAVATAAAGVCLCLRGAQVVRAVGAQAPHTLGVPLPSVAK